MQLSTDCPSSPISQLAARQKQQKWTSKSSTSLSFSVCLRNPTAVFTLNEPDTNGISPSQAATWYKQNIQPLPIKRALPAITSSTNAGQGLDWLQQMVKACAGCTFDYINLHWYGPDFPTFQKYVEQARSKFPVRLSR